MQKDYVWAVEIKNYRFIEEVLLFTTRQKARDYKKNVVDIHYANGWIAKAKDCRVYKYYIEG